jgi:hypothetical protein
LINTIPGSKVPLALSAGFKFEPKPSIGGSGTPSTGLTSKLEGLFLRRDTHFPGASSGDLDLALLDSLSLLDLDLSSDLDLSRRSRDLNQIHIK